MRAPTADLPVSDVEAHEALQHLLAYPPAAASRQLQNLLSYVLTEELAGRGDKIKAYSVAVDALGRDDSFDPAVDASVRVLARRTRTVIQQYYDGPGANDPVRIELGKGSYRPLISRRNLIEDTPVNPVDVRAAPTIAPEVVRQWLFVAAASVLIVVITGSLWLTGSSMSPVKQAFEKLPVVEVLPFRASTGNGDEILAEGIRQQLIVDISRFDSIRVRALPGNASSSIETREQIEPADYKIGGTFIENGKNTQLAVTATTVASGDILWSNNVRLPTNDAEFQDLLYSTIRSIVTNLAATNGAIHMQAINQLRQRSASLGNVNTTNYECVLHYYAFDLTKSVAEEVAAHECLQRLTKAGTQDSSIWASWAFLQFLDWTKSDSGLDAPIIESALISARKATQLDPYNATAFETVGSIVMAMGARDEALENYKKALQLNPSKPDLYVLLGWYDTLEGHWSTGIPQIEQGVALSPAPPGWMRIPLSIDAFRRGDFATAYDRAETIMQSGDERGIILALAAAIALKDETRMARLRDAFVGSGNVDIKDPMREIRNVFNAPDILQSYEKILQRVDLGPNT